MRANEREIMPFDWLIYQDEPIFVRFGRYVQWHGPRTIKKRRRARAKSRG